MDKLKAHLQQQIVANVIVDKCKQSENLIIREAWCSQERVIRFTTPFFRELFSYKESQEGKWKTGDCVMYEAYNNIGSFVVNCVLSNSSLSYDQMDLRDEVIKVLNIDNEAISSEIILYSWDITSDDTNKLFDKFDNFIYKQIPFFEQEIKEKLTKPNDDTKTTEGAVEYVTLDRYERSREARQACIAAHGYACAVCGMEFSKEYGDDFAGMIEVHHIIPISQFRKEHVVDPAKDLVPVCPNCHAALHHKKDGVYTVDELKKIREKNMSNRG